MTIYSDEMATSQSVATTLAAMTGSPYAPLQNGRLLRVILLAAGDAVTSLIETVTVKLTCTSFKGVNVWVGIAGANIRTAPAFPIPVGIVDCDVPVATGVNITCEIVNRTGATPVTPQFVLIGVFEGTD